MVLPNPKSLAKKQEEEKEKEEHIELQSILRFTQRRQKILWVLHPVESGQITQINLNSYIQCSKNEFICYELFSIPWLKIY